MTESLRSLQHPRFARFYARISTRAEAHGAAAHRTRLLAGLTGFVIEVGAGNGLNFAYYPAGVTGVLAVEPDDTLREHARRAARHAPVAVDVVAGHADALPAADAAFDAAVTSLVLCTVPDPGHALAEIRRVLRPGGQLRFYEHVRSDKPALAWLQDRVAPLWSRLAGGCRPNHDTATVIAANGFTIDTCERFGFSPASGMPQFAHILGTARPRADTHDD
ncbi:class I SAM-dependent methyltransferase [Catellatospora chokoriensis]|uniref:Methyltransferase type 11 n=1 Tax=Catellatospora chokoriensis TaxID=310353 RepID=A0A8J3K9F6_9ACTN|nr:methyltransferase domain-containing protein [Catellatospora chokoriensis]GIF93075.1 methyltransferase type 11 [Catellatospora chokoriensis]